MCRFAAYVGMPASPVPLVFHGDHSLFRQSWDPREMLSGSVNADGYGVVWYGEGHPRRIADDRPIWHDADLEGALGGFVSPCLMAALRNGTPGLPVDRSSLIPMVHDRWSFVLNGFVPDFRSRHMRAMRAELPDDLYASLTGVSDTETLFLLAVASLREGASAADALRSVRDRVAERVGEAEAQLVMALADGTRVVALRGGTVASTNSLYVSERPGFLSGGTVLASEPLDTAEEWRPVEPHSVVEIDFQGARQLSGPRT